jgi:RimJ/RimL family protein N-acetyltransferase
MAVTIREAQPEDFESVQHFLMQEFIKSGYTDADMAGLADQPCHPANGARLVTTVPVTDGPVPRAWLARVDGRDVGLITTKDASGGVIVDPAFRGQGIAGKLIAARADYAARHGATEAEAHILADNESSLRAFTKMGYAFTQAAQKMIDEAAAQGIPRAAMKDEKTGRAPVLTLVKPL